MLKQYEISFSNVKFDQNDIRTRFYLENQKKIRQHLKLKNNHLSEANKKEIKLYGSLFFRQFHKKYP